MDTKYAERLSKVAELKSKLAQQAGQLAQQTHFTEIHAEAANAHDRAREAHLDAEAVWTEQPGIAAKARAKSHYLQALKHDDAMLFHLGKS